MQGLERVGIGSFVTAKLKDYAMLMKFRLSLLVVFSSGIGFLIGANGNWSWQNFIMISLGGMLTAGASNALNQVIEKDFDRLMKRTANRPLPTERMNTIEAILFSGVLAIGGLGILWLYFNQAAALLSAIALISYAFIYTPMKRFSPVAVYLGAIPGALPPMIGFVAATNLINAESGLLFLIQFFWQLPHFWAIGWVAYDDYMKAGYKLLPSKDGQSKTSAMQTIVSIVVLIAFSVLPYYFHYAGVVSLIILLTIGVVFLYQSIKLYRDCTVASARQLMFGSFFYLPIVQLALYFDKI
ncbi:MAG TPA: protoheme IX farnesyltransferase [Bacteroidetes bacterium]|nr:protoheme IX farnesyltransferase [Bacteroidota bacterium]